MQIIRWKKKYPESKETLKKNWRPAGRLNPQLSDYYWVECYIAIICDSYILLSRYLIIRVRSSWSLMLFSTVVATVVGAGVRRLLASGSGSRGGGRAVGGALAQRRQLWGRVPTTAAGVVASVEGTKGEGRR